VEGIPFERGVHPHGDRKSAEAFESKGVARCPLRKRVRKPLEEKELNEVEELKDDARARHGGRSATGHFPTPSESTIELQCGHFEAQCKQTRKRIAESTRRVNYFIGTVRTVCGKIPESPTRKIGAMGRPNSS
jgi:hypothetical protein